MRTVSINNGSYMHMNLGAYDCINEGFIMLSAFDYTTAVKAAARDINKKNNIAIANKSFLLESKAYEVFTSRQEDSDYSHIIAYKKDAVAPDITGRERIVAFIFLQRKEDLQETIQDMACNHDPYPEDLQDAVFAKLNKLSPVPILREWIPYLMDGMIENGNLYSAKTYANDTNRHFYCFVLRTYTDELINRISTGLKNQEISIKGTHEVSQTMQELEGIDAYLNTFSGTLTDKIQKKFKPRFMPQHDDYSQTLKDVSDYMSCRGNLNLYHAQQDVIQATALTWKNKKSAFIIGEQGIGKTPIGIASVLTANEDKKWMTVLIQCPSHLVQKWKREIERLAPLSDAYIIEDFDQLFAFKKKIEDPHRHRHLWLIISKETAKYGYDERPAAVWSAKKKCYVCPDCGQPLYYKTYEGKGKKRHEVRHYLDELGFRKKMKGKNIVCHNTVRVWNHKTNDWQTYPCRAKLWEPAMREQLTKGKRSGGSWVKLPKSGWIERRHADKLYEKLTSGEMKDMDLLDDLDALREMEPVQYAPRKYPIARYVRKYLKGKIDYFIADEVQELKAKNSLQGIAFGDFVYAAKHVLALTGTLLNGYANSIYYTLFRMFARQMKKEGYGYDDEIEFSKDYGVTRKSSFYENYNGKAGEKTKQTVKALPGISPLVFTKFLLENAAFISLNDISDALPNYQEIPVSVDMDYSLEEAYRELEKKSGNLMRSKEFGKGGKIISQVIQLLSVYPDQPYHQPPIINPETGEKELVPFELEDAMRTGEALTYKERKLLELVKERKEAGEKILIYYNWTGRTNLGERLPEILEKEGISSAVLTEHTVSASKREAWIEKEVREKDIDVLICNPELVKTGLDLLDFTTIIWYQVGYNLFTMEQASRRSLRLSQTKDVTVYFLFYKGTVQEQALSLMATKKTAAAAIQGEFSAEGLAAMSNNEDILTQIAASVTKGIKETVNIQVFQKNEVAKEKKQLEEKAVKKEKWQAKKLDAYTFFKMPKKRRRNRKAHIDPMLSVNAISAEVIDNPQLLLSAS